MEDRSKDLNNFKRDTRSGRANRINSHVNKISSQARNFNTL